MRILSNDHLYVLRAASIGPPLEWDETDPDHARWEAVHADLCDLGLMVSESVFVPEDDEFYAGLEIEYAITEKGERELALQQLSRAVSA